MVSVKLYPYILCVSLLMNLFVLCVACWTVFVNCLQHRIQRTMFLKMKPPLAYLPPTHLAAKAGSSLHVTS